MVRRTSTHWFILAFAFLCKCQLKQESHVHYTALEHQSKSTDLQESEVSGMVKAASDFLQSLSEKERSKALTQFDDSERKKWDFWPSRYEGIPINDISKESQKLAKQLIASGLSSQGLTKLEVIHALEKFNPYRSPHYSILIFGEPNNIEPWGWRFQGHHTSLNFTITNGEVVANTPSFLGTQPLSHPSVAKGEKPLKLEQELAWQLYSSLSTDQKTKTDVSRPPQYYLPERSERFDPYPGKTLLYQDMNEKQQNLLIELMGSYIHNMRKEIAQARLNEIEKAGLSTIGFAFNGEPKLGANHYYRIQGPSFIMEYDCRDNGNHIHAVWRDFDGDFGEDVLSEHLKNHKH